jgi:hypothetical protein
VIAVLAGERDDREACGDGDAGDERVQHDPQGGPDGEASSDMEGAPEASADGPGPGSEPEPTAPAAIRVAAHRGSTRIARVTM